MKRLWGIRHIRYFWHLYHAIRWVQMWYRAGIGLGVLNPADEATLDAIWEGKA